MPPLQQAREAQFPQTLLTAPALGSSLHLGRPPPHPLQSLHFPFERQSPLPHMAAIRTRRPFSSGHSLAAMVTAHAAAWSSSAAFPSQPSGFCWPNPQGCQGPSGLNLQQAGIPSTCADVPPEA